MDNHKVAVVTGAGAGIGRAIALKLAEQHSIVVSDVNDDTGQRVVDEITGNGGTASYLRVDAASPEDNQALVEHAVTTFGGLDLAVNNAGIGVPQKKIGEVTTEEFDRCISVTLRGTFLGLREQLKYMQDNAGGSIVNIASTGGLKAEPTLATYAAAKHGVVAVTRAAALEYAEYGIRVNGVAPGPIETAAFATVPEEARREFEREVPMQRIGQAEEIAEATDWLLTGKAPFVNGVILPVDGAWVIS